MFYSISRDNTNMLKGIAIFFVLLGHMGYIDTGGAWGVHLFLIISGYGIFHSVKNNGISGYWKKRFVTVYLPYLMCTFLFLLFRIFVGEKISLISCLISILGLDLNLNLDPTMWYISFIFYWYFAFWIFWILFNKNKKFSFFIGLLFIIFVGFIGYKGIWWHKGTIAWAYIFSFPLGVSVGALSRININDKLMNFILKIVLTISLIYVFMKYGHSHRAFEQLLFTLLAALIPFCLILKFPRSSMFGGSFLGVVGMYSYGMYLNEGFLLQYKKLLFPFNNVLLEDMMLIICSFILSVIVNKSIINLREYIPSCKQYKLMLNKGR